jgi:ribosomal protein S18 acetylase RimI-like enzyme
LTTEQVTIRRARADDAAALAELAERTFRDAFAADNDPADMADYCVTAFGPGQQRAQIADPEIDTLVVIDAHDRMVGYVQLRPGQPVEGEAPEPIELWRFYVDAAHHGRGIAQQMMDATLEAAAKRRAKTLWLGVWERNFRAQAFYRKYQFVEIGSHTFTLGHDRQTDLLMARPIT